MSDDKKYDRHAGLVDRMAGTQGIDMDEAVQRGDLAPGELEQTIYTCLGCSQTEACERWLSLNAEGAEATPGYCRNEAVFKSLKE
jgi:hypothetical protein